MGPATGSQVSHRCWSLEQKGRSVGIRYGSRLGRQERKGGTAGSAAPERPSAQNDWMSTEKSSLCQASCPGTWGDEPQLHRSNTDLSPLSRWQPQKWGNCGFGARTKHFNTQRAKPWCRLLTGQSLKGTRGRGIYSHRLPRGLNLGRLACGAARSSSVWRT